MASLHSQLCLRHAMDDHFQKVLGATAMRGVLAVPRSSLLQRETPVVIG